MNKKFRNELLRSGTSELVDANLALIARMEAKIKAKLDEVWGEPSVAPSELSDTSNPSDSLP